MLDVARWLAEQGLEQYAEAFVANAIDGESCARSPGTISRSWALGLGHRKRLLEAIAALEPGTGVLAAGRRHGRRRLA